METRRIALIRYDSPVNGEPCVGSGLLVDSRHVLTADHVAGGSGYMAECAGSEVPVVSILRSGDPAVDLAVLTLRDQVRGLDRLPCGRVARRQVDRVTDCVAVGFPRWKKDKDQRLSAQVHGWVPTAEGLERAADAGLRAGYLTLVGDRLPPGAPSIPSSDLTEQADSPWGGMSGAGVAVSDVIIGVVRSHNLAAGGQSLTVTPVAALEQLPDALRWQFWDVLGVDDPDLLTVFPDPLGGAQGISFNAQVLRSVLTAHQDSHFRVGGGIKSDRMRSLREEHQIPAAEEILAVFSWEKLVHFYPRNLIFTDWGVRVRDKDERLAFSYNEIVKYEFEFIEYDQGYERAPLRFLRITGEGRVMSCGPQISFSLYSVHECLNEIKANVQGRRSSR